MATDVKKHTIPGANDTPRRATFDELSLSVRDFIPVADTTERAQLIADLIAAGEGPTAAVPVVVYRQDAVLMRRFEFTTDGTTWTPFNSAPVTLRGTVTITAGVGQTQSQTVTFPTGTFSAPPVVLTTVRTGTPADSRSSTNIPTAAGVTIYLRNDATSELTRTVAWTATEA